ncbi:MAG: TVP38/TMEM64 family protein, partial [Pseudomonadota bacterium]
MDQATTSRRPTRTLGAVLFLAMVLGLAVLLSGYVNLAEMNDRLAAARGWINVHAGLAALIFAAAYVVATSLSLPGATALTLVGGSLFGLWAGTLLVSLASVIGATTGMIVARYFLRDAIERRFPDVVAKVNRGIAADGPRYLFALRLVPVVPFFLVNLTMGLTRMPVRTFAWVSQLGMLPGTVAYVNAGQQLASIDSAG